MSSGRISGLAANRHAGGAWRFHRSDLGEQEGRVKETQSSKRLLLETQLGQAGAFCRNLGRLQGAAVLKGKVQEKQGKYSDSGFTATQFLTVMPEDS